MSRVGWGRLIFAVAVLALWQIAAMTFASFVLPTPLKTFQTLYAGFAQGFLLDATLVTLGETIPAFILAVIVGLFFGCALGVARFWGEVFEPLILGTYSIPKITLYPIFLLLFKVGSASKIAFGFFHGVFPVEIVSQAATENLRPVYVKVARTLGLSPWQTTIHVVLPAILPSLVVGLRLGFSLTFIGVVLGEIIASKAGLGLLLSAADATFDIDRTLAVVIILAFIGITVNQLFYAWERRVSPSRSQARQAPLAL